MENFLFPDTSRSGKKSPYKGVYGYKQLVICNSEHVSCGMRRPVTDAWAVSHNPSLRTAIFILENAGVV